MEKIRDLLLTNGLDKNSHCVYNSKTGLIDVYGNFYLRFWNITDLSSINFGRITGNFILAYNQLGSLKGAPREVEGHFVCSFNELTSLEGAPEIIGGDFHCSNNKLTSLEGAPEIIGGDFHCVENPLINLNRITKNIKGVLYLDNFNLSHKNLKELRWILDNIKKYPILKTLLTSEIVQKMINYYPNETVLDLKDVWCALKNEPGFDKLVFPKGTKGVLDNLGTLEEFGL